MKHESLESCVNIFGLVVGPPIFGVVCYREALSNQYNRYKRGLYNYSTT